MAFENITYTVNKRIATITINRETKLNALNRATLAEISAAVKLAMDDADTGGIIITGAGNKAFAAGGDITEFAAHSEEQARVMAEEVHAEIFNLIENCNKPVLAAVNGYALGGGLELAMACHIRVAADTAKVGLPEVTLGLIPGYGGTQRLTKLAGKGRAMQMILTAEMVLATDAAKFGIINEVVPAGELMERAVAIMQSILLKAPLAVAAAIKAINAAGTANGFATEIDEFAACFGTADMQEGVAAFVEKRKPTFKGV